MKVSPETLPIIADQLNGYAALRDVPTEIAEKIRGAIDMLSDDPLLATRSVTYIQTQLTTLVNIGARHLHDRQQRPRQRRQRCQQCHGERQPCDRFGDGR